MVLSFNHWVMIGW